MKGYLFTRIMMIRGTWHVERRVNNRWVIKCFTSYPNEDMIEKAFQDA